MHQTAPRKYYLSWTDTTYERYEDDFDNKDALLEFVNERAGRPGFRIFRVVLGRELALTPVDVVKQYTIDD